MLISHEKKFIFLKTYKTGSSSIEEYLKKYCGEVHEDYGKYGFPIKNCIVSNMGVITYPRCNVIAPPRNDHFWDHMSAQEVKNKISPRIWNEYYKFCVVRNPFDKLKSFYYFVNHKMYKMKNSSYIKELYSDEYNIGLQYINNNIDFIEGIEQANSFGENIYDTSIYTMDNSVCVDFVIKYENFENDINEVFEKLNIPYEPDKFPKINSSITPYGISNKEFYNENMINFVKEKYSFEIENFGYTL